MSKEKTRAELSAEIKVLEAKNAELKIKYETSMKELEEQNAELKAKYETSLKELEEQKIAYKGANDRARLYQKSVEDSKKTLDRMDSDLLAKAQECEQLKEDLKWVKQSREQLKEDLKAMTQDRDNQMSAKVSLQNMHADLADELQDLKEHGLLHFLIWKLRK